MSLAEDRARLNSREDIARLKGEVATALNDDKYNTLAAIAEAKDETRNRQLDDLWGKFSG